MRKAIHERSNVIHVAVLISMIIQLPWRRVDIAYAIVYWYDEIVAMTTKTVVTIATYYSL